MDRPPINTYTHRLPNFSIIRHGPEQTIGQGDSETVLVR